MSPTPAIEPSVRRAVMPEMKTSRPWASIAVAWENTPLGWRSLSERICCLGIRELPTIARRARRPANSYQGESLEIFALGNRQRFAGADDVAYEAAA